MIISKAPVRITLSGGTTDLKSYYSRKGGFLIAAALDKYIRVVVQKQYSTEPVFVLRHAHEEKAFQIEDILHPLLRESLSYCGIAPPLEVVSFSDVPPSCGLGTSGAFTVALLGALYSYLGISKTKEELAEIACEIEIDIVGAPVGKQDQYASACGGINCYTFHKDGVVEVQPLKLKDAEELNQRLMLFDTGIPRRSADVLTSCLARMKEEDGLIDRLDTVKEMALEAKRLLECGDLDSFGSLLNDYWQVRKSLSSNISNPQIDEYYEKALKHGALGGKIIGAGAGGFLMLYCPKNQEKLEAAMPLRRLKYKWDFDGAKVYNL